MKKVLELPAFRRLLVATIFNELAWWIGSVSLALLVYHRTGSALGATAFFLCSQLGPALISPFLVARLDRAVPNRMLAELYGLEGAIFLLMAWLVSHFALASVLVLVLMDGLLFMTARVLTRTAWSSVTARSDLIREANAVFSGSLSVCIMMGPALGGALVALGGTKTALLVNVGMFVLVAVLVGTTRGLRTMPGEKTGATVRLGAALRYVRNEPTTRRLLALQTLAVVFFTISLPIEVVFVRQTLRAGAGGYGLLLGVWGGGAILGGLAYARWRQLPSRLLITLGSCAYAVGFLLMALAPSLTVAVVGAGIAGVGNGSQYVAFRSALQERTPESWMSMILSLTESLFQAVPGLGIVVGGAITVLAGPRPAFAVAAAGSVVAAVGMWFGFSGDRRRHESADTDARIDAAAQVTPLTIGEPRV